MSTLKVANQVYKGSIKVLNQVGGLQGNVKSPQVTVPTQVVQRASTPQQTQGTISHAQANNARVNPNWAQEQATRLRLQEAEAKIQRKRLADIQIAGYKGNIAGQLLDKAKGGLAFKERSKREQAVKYLEENDKNWSVNIISRQTYLEKKQAELQDWIMQSSSQAEGDKRYAEATSWLDKNWKALEDDYTDYTKTQKELSAYSQTPLPGKLMGGLSRAGSLLKTASTSGFNILSNTISQPERLINTALNGVNPNRLRTYYGGAEAKGGISKQGSLLDQLKRNYNITKDQRIIGWSNATEEAKTKPGKVGTTKMPDGSIRDVYRKNNPLGNFITKYGDDVANQVVNPINWVGAGSIGKASKLLSSNLGKIGSSSSGFALGQIGKNKQLRDLALTTSVGARSILDKFNDSKAGSALKWLGKPQENKFTKWSDETQPARDEVQRLVDEINVKKEGWAKTKGRYDSIAQQVAKLTPEQNLLFTQYVRANTIASQGARGLKKAPYSWQGIDMPKNMTKQEKGFIKNLADRWKSKSDELFWDGKGMGEKYSYRQGYLPQYKGSSGVVDQRPSGAPWYSKEQQTQDLQTPEQLASSINKRASTQLWRSDPNARWLDDNAGRYTKRIGSMINAMEASKPTMNTWDMIERFMPMNIWRKSVLKYLPSWYVNNAGTNTAFSVSGGGLKALQYQTKLTTNSKYRKEVFSSLPKGVLSNINLEVGKANAASFLENIARSSVFLANKDKGLSDAEALKIVNRWLIDYTTKNWERPIKGILPFYQWQKFLLSKSISMPFTNPRSAQVYSQTYNKYYKRPYESLPDEEQTFEDQETGETVTYNPRKAYKGKAYLGTDKDGNQRFANTPFFALNPDTILNAGINPFLSTGIDFANSKDRYGNKNTDKKAWQLLAEKFPQFNLAKSATDLSKKIHGRLPLNTKTWFSPTGNSKVRQGNDPSKPNYDKSLDKSLNFGKTAKSFLGIPNVVKFEPKKYDVQKRLTKFNADFFAIDWKALEGKDYKQAQQAKKDLASKYGFDLKKDIYDNYWSKYDTATTANTKKLKEDAGKFNQDFWTGYYAKKPGSLTAPSERRPYVIGKFDEWKANHTFAKNPYYKIPKFKEQAINPYTLRNQEATSQAKRSAGRLKYARKLAYERGDWAELKRLGGGSSGVEANGKYFKTTESRDKYLKGVAKHDFWEKFFALKTTSARQELLDAHPEIERNPVPTTQAEWDALRLRLRNERKQKAGTISGFDMTQAEIRRAIEKSVKTLSKKQARLRFKY